MAELTADEVIERAGCNLFWVPADTTIVDRDEILYTVSPNPFIHLNAVLRLRADNRRIPALVAEVRAAHARRPSRWFVRGACLDETLEQCLLRGGYRPSHTHHAYTLDVAGCRPVPTPGITAYPVDSLERLREWVAVNSEAFESQTRPSEERMLEELEQCKGPGALVHRFVACDDATGEPLSAGSVTAHRDLGFGFLWGGGTVRHGRGRGAYRAVLAARLERAAAVGLTRVGLHARTATSAPIVEKLGFSRHGEMTHWDRR